MKVLTMNFGSSSVKYQLFEITDTEKTRLAKGLIEHTGSGTYIATYHPAGGEKIREVMQIPDTAAYLKIILEALTHKKYGVIKSGDEIKAVGHRIAHGGEHFKESVVITEEVKEKIKEYASLVPLHQIYELQGMELAEALFPHAAHTAIFDTSFHSHMPPHAYIYPIPYHYYKRYGIRRYGFHGTSHYYVSLRASELLKQPYDKLKIITCHLGNGASMAAVKNGVSIDTSMGFTSLEGLVMGTRCGDIDPGIIPQIIAKEGITAEECSTLLNRSSGLVGISGISNDMRDIVAEMEKGNEMAKLAFDIYTYRIRKYISAYAGAMGGADAIVFTAGVGERSPLVRKACCEGLSFMGVTLDSVKNKNVVSKEGVISDEHSPVKVFCIPTNEELIMAMDTYKLVKS
ncbi:acetate kinase [bacterium]|nr:acetate kinase [bacterium]MBU3956040.1 acetate kinase [bacterium]